MVVVADSDRVEGKTVFDSQDIVSLVELVNVHISAHQLPTSGSRLDLSSSVEDSAIVENEHIVFFQLELLPEFTALNHLSKFGVSCKNTILVNKFESF